MAIIHIVHFAYKATCDAGTKADIADKFLKLKQTCLNKDGKPYILDITGGKNNSTEGVSEGLEVSTHAMLSLRSCKWMCERLRDPITLVVSYFGVFQLTPGFPSLGYSTRSLSSSQTCKTETTTLEQTSYMQTLPSSSAPTGLNGR